jgi:hypothetical protein
VKKVKKIDEMYAYVAVDPDDNTEGIVSFFGGLGNMPMVSADMENVEGLRPIAEEAAKQSGAVIRLVRFTNRELIETIEYDDD